jgi:hypothetical protein
LSGRVYFFLLAAKNTGARRIIANKIIECANRGDTTLSRLTEAGYAAAMQLTASVPVRNSVKKKEAAN